MDDSANKLKELDDKINKINNKIDKITVKKRDLINKRRKILHKNYKIVYRIMCIPSEKNHIAHTVGCFSTYEKAEQTLPKKSLVRSHGCNWSYSIVVKKSSVNDMDKLDKHPYDFPY